MYLCKTELFEIELFICIKMDLAFNKLQLFIWLFLFNVLYTFLGYLIPNLYFRKDNSDTI